jgi:hypothetical protein
MITIGNFFLVIAALVFLLMCNLIYFTRMPGGDAVVGYAWSLILGILTFSICLVIVTAIIGWQGGFGWVGASGGQRTLLVVGGVVLILIGNGFFMAGENPSDMPAVLRPILKAIPAILPPLLLVGAAILLNGKQAAVPAIAYKLPIYAGLFVGALAVGILMLANAQRNAAILRSKSDYADKTHQDRLNNIDSTDVMKNGVFLYVYTDANHKMDLREKALAKIKSRPDWQEELTRRLQNDWAPEAFNFLASNDVEDKSLFPEAVRQGVLIQARLIRESISRCRDKYSLYEGRFTWEVDRVLRTIDKFEGMGVDYHSAVQELRNSFDEPTSFEKPRLPAKEMLDNWLKEH